MPAYQLHVYEQPEEREVLERKICEQVDACTEVNGIIRNRVKKFLIEEGITDISEMDVPLRIRYEEYLKRNETVYAPLTCLRGFDRILIHRMKEELKTLAGRRTYTTEYREQWMCLTHYPEIEIAESFLASKNGKELLWDFTLECPKNLKIQIFTVLKEVIHTYEGWARKEKLLVLQRLYQFCAENQVSDIETMTLEEEQRFELELSGHFCRKKKSMGFAVIRMSRKILFLQAAEIHWKANVWFLERFHFSRERMNPSKLIERMSFKEVTNLENQKILQKYLRYLFGITDLSISTIRIKLLELRTFLSCFNEESKPIYEMEAEKIQKYLEGIRNQNTREATSNGRIFIILQFYNFLVVKGYLKKIPFRHEYYLQKEVRVHNDRSVSEEVYVEILSKLAEFPEHLRLMFLHLWCTGIRGSEVCTLTGGDYEEKNGDYWLKVYQVKMKTYKRIPIPEALYQLVQVYKKKYQIGPEEYLFQNQKGGAFRYETFRCQMLKYCEMHQIADGEYIFRSHDYRHNLATLYYDSGISIQAVRDYLGHEYEEMTRQYVDYMPKKLEKASESYFQEESHSFAAELMKGEFHG
ncbi:MAG: tyrosine-type recombinase/integrase [Roseburia faecis]